LAVNKIAVRLPIVIPSQPVTALLASQALALVWWGAALYIWSLNLIPVWIDQQRIFMPITQQIADPFQVVFFANPPWTAVLLAPFSWLPMPIAALAQACLYFAILTGIILKLGGQLNTVLIALTSFLAFDAVIELNVEWLVALGLLVPPTWSGPLLLVKPQVAPGYVLSFTRRQLVRSGLVVLAVVLVSLVIWPGWPLQMRDAAASLTGRSYNVAPMSLLSPVISLAVGAVIAWQAVRRHDAVIGVLAGLFFVPYIAFYSLFIPFTLSAVRWPRAALLVSIIVWMVYGGVLGYGLLLR
jgi:hypothetical protein